MDRSLLPPPPGRIQHQVIYLPCSSHISPLVHIPNATSITPATLVPTLPLQCSSPNGQLPALPFPQTLQWLPSTVHQTLWALLCPQPHNIAHVFCPLGSSHTGLRNTLPPPTSGLCTYCFFHLVPLSAPLHLLLNSFRPSEASLTLPPQYAFRALCFLLLTLITVCNYIFGWLFDEYLPPSLPLKAS